MKKYFLILLMILVLPFNVSAKSDFELNCDNDNLNEFEEVTCRTSLTSDFEFNKIVFELSLSKGLTLNEIRSNFTSLWKLEYKDNLIIAETKGGLFVNGLQEFGILLLESNNFGTQKIKIENIKLINTETSKEKSLSNIEQKIKVMSSNNELKSLTIDSKKLKNFKSNIYTYIINVKDEEKLNIDAVSVDANAKIIGIGEIILDKTNKTTVKVITVKSESGVNKNYLLYFVRDIEDNNITAKEINITDDKNKPVEFNFKQDIYEYNIEVGTNTKKININVVLDGKEYSLVKEFGNQTINIEDGDNTVLIKVKNSEGKIKTYIFNITKLLSNKSENYYLKSLKINKYNLKFNKRVKNYKLSVKKGTKSLDIKAIPEDKTSVVSIVGNDKLHEGSIIKITVQAENESRFTYYVEINYEKNNILINLLFIILIFSLSGGLFELYRKNKKTKVEISRDKNKNQVKPVVKNKTKSSKNITINNDKNYKKEVKTKEGLKKTTNNKVVKSDIKTEKSNKMTTKKTNNKKTSSDVKSNKINKPVDKKLPNNKNGNKNNNTNHVTKSNNISSKSNENNKNKKRNVPRKKK